MQYGDSPLPIGSEYSCDVCHKQIEYPIHHPNMVRDFRNTEVVQK